MKEIKCIDRNEVAEIVEKKSRFIAHVFYVETAEQAGKYIEDIKKKFYDARHNVFAYSIYNKVNYTVSKYSDDGEPQGTAGSPILKIINEKGLTNILVIVTRYFGGTLLGTGRLVRAYSESSIKAIEKCRNICKEMGCEVKINLEYGELDKLKYYAIKRNIKILDIQYLDNIEITMEITEAVAEELTNNNNKKGFKLLKYDVLKEKFVDKYRV